MGSLILRSKSALLINGNNSIDFLTYKQRVYEDGGVIINEQSVIDAYEFARNSNLDASNVFSATNAAWGIKFSGDKLVRLYSLFGEVGDLIPASNVVTVKGLTTANPYVSLTGSNYTNFLTSVGVFNNSENIAVTLMNRVPIITGSYSNSLYLSLASVANFDKGSFTRDDYVDGLSIDLGFKRDSISNDDISTWSGYLSTPDSNLEEPNMAKPSWNNITSFLQAGSAKAYQNGVEKMGASSGYLGIKKPDNQSLMLGARRPDFNYPDKAMFASVVDFAGVWCVYNVKQPTVLALAAKTP